MDKSVEKQSTKTTLRTWRSVLTARPALLLVSGLVLAVAIGLLGYHQYQWSRSVEQAQTDYGVAVEQSKAIFEGEDISIEAIDELASMAGAAADELCTSPFLADVRTQWLESARQQKERCQGDAKKLQQVSAAASKVRSWLGAEQELASVYSQAQQSLAKANTSDYSGQQKIWREVKSELNSTGVGGQLYADIRLNQSRVVDKIISSYDALIKANKDKKRPDFDVALKNLQGAYDGLSEVTEGIEKGYREYAEHLAAAIESL